MDIAKRIRELRKDRGLSQEAVARRAGISLNGVARLEAGSVADPHYSTLAGIAKALDMSISELLEEER